MHILDALNIVLDYYKVAFRFEFMQFFCCSANSAYFFKNEFDL